MSIGKKMLASARRRRRVKSFRKKPRRLLWRGVVWLSVFLIRTLKRIFEARQHTKCRLLENNVSSKNQKPKSLPRERFSNTGGRGSATITNQELILLDATSALMNLGYRKSQAAAAIRVAANTAGEDVDIATLIKVGLKNLARC